MDQGSSNRMSLDSLELCFQRLRQYREDLRDHPTLKSNEEWENFVKEHYSPAAKKKWCFTSYDIAGTYRLMNMDTWNCEICGTETGKGFETNFGALPRLFKMKYAAMKAISEDSTFGMICATLSPDGNFILDFGRVSEETAYGQFYVVHEGSRRIKYDANLKILSWEFCCQSQKVLDSQRARVPESQLNELQQLGQVNELGFPPNFLHELHIIMNSADNQEVPQNENPAVDQQLNQDVNPEDDQELPQNENPQDDQNEDKDLMFRMDM